MPYVVDTNVHLLAVDPAGEPVPPPTGRVPAWWQGATAEQVRGHMQQAGIDRALVVATGSYDDSYCVTSAQRYPDSFTAIAKLDASGPDAAAALSRLVEQPGVGGVRFEWRSEGVSPSEWLDAPQTLRLWEEAERVRIRVSLASVRKMEHLTALRPRECGRSRPSAWSDALHDRGRHDPAHLWGLRRLGTAHCTRWPSLIPASNHHQHAQAR